ncbi:MAG TPA: hypothetical protein VEX35_05015 [Allosphingosinicella sp.]|nr:hypothetical protein [Allosphingosinicella sp.]
MSEAPPHPSSGPRGAGPLLLRLLAGLMVVLAGACALLFVPFTLLIAATSNPGELAPGIAPWMIYLWCLFAFAASIGVVMAGVGAMETPRAGRVFVLLGVTAAVFLSFPPFVPVAA